MADENDDVYGRRHRWHGGGLERDLDRGAYPSPGEPTRAGGWWGREASGPMGYGGGGVPETYGMLDAGFHGRAHEIRGGYRDEYPDAVGFGTYGFGDARRDEMERRQEGPHRGRGPRNYRRPDARIAEDVNDRLTEHPHLDASEIEVRVEDGEVTLAGTVHDRRSKRLAEDIADGVSGVRDVHNRITIRRLTMGEEARAPAETVLDREVARPTKMDRTVAGKRRTAGKGE